MTPKNKIAVAAFATAFLGLALPGAWESYRAALGPLDLAPAAQGSTIVVDKDNRLLRAFTMDDGRWRLPITHKDVDPRFIAMLAAYEDRRFYNHAGVDGRAMGRAAIQFLRNGRVISGGSTLTMQVARLLEPRDERNISAKSRQMVRALQLESRFSKNEVLDLYLTLAPYGGNLEGLRAASISYFGKEPKRLSNSECALLVALPQSPESRRPDRAPESARKARNRVLDRAFAAGLLTSAELDSAKHDPIPTERRAFPVLAAHASEAAVRQEPNTRIHRLTLDSRLQASLEGLARETAARLGPKLSAAILVIDNATGQLRAHVAAAHYLGQDSSGAIDMTQAIRSPGSTLKPFIYGMAFEDGFVHPESLIDDRPVRFGNYAPENFDMSFQGAVTARRALQLSLNVPAVELLADVGPSRLLARLRNAGASLVLSKDAAPGLAIGLGGLGIKLNDLARLYAGLARGGSVPQLLIRQGQVQQELGQLTRISEPVASWYVSDILRGAPPPLNASSGRIAFKTGTSYGYRDAFAIGFDKRYTVAVWVGRPDNGAVPGLVGRAVAAPALFDTFARIGGETEFAPAPRDALMARTSDLPPPLRHLRKDTPKTLAAATSAQLKIAYPPDGARVDLGLARGVSAETAALALKAQGGVPPLRWMVNGAPIGEPELRRQSAWTPDGAGFARVSVMDARGFSDSVMVRLE